MVIENIKDNYSTNSGASIISTKTLILRKIHFQQCLCFRLVVCFRGIKIHKMYVSGNQEAESSACMWSKHSFYEELLDDPLGCGLKNFESEME